MFGRDVSAVLQETTAAAAFARPASRRVARRREKTEYFLWPDRNGPNGHGQDDRPDVGTKAKTDPGGLACCGWPSPYNTAATFGEVCAPEDGDTQSSPPLRDAPAGALDSL